MRRHTQWLASFEKLALPMYKLGKDKLAREPALAATLALAEIVVDE